MKRIMLVIMLLVSGTLSFAQTGNLKIKASDKGLKEIIPFAKVLVSHIGSTITLTGTTDLNGEITFKLLTPGRYKVIISYVGFNKFEKQGVIISSNKTTIMDAFLQGVSVALLEPVEIVTTSLPIINSDVSAPSIITREESFDRIEYSETIERDIAISSSYDAVSEKKASVMTEPKNGVGGGVVVGRSGVLTAGQINDFGKWEIWKDVSSNELGKNNIQWKISPLCRYFIQVTNTEQKPVIDVPIELFGSAGELLWKARTDNTGKAELWRNIFEEKMVSGNPSIKITYKGKSYEVKNPKTFSEGVNVVQIKTPCDVPQKADVMFVVDATGSMGDEIGYLKEELNNIIEQVKKNNAFEINLGSVFYRDHGDEYVTRKIDFSSDEKKTIEFIKNQRADGGGDFPEAVHSALEVAVNEMKWSENATARLMFLVLDAPPHVSPQVLESLHKSLQLAAEKGIRIIPIASSGVDKSTEYLMRAFALASNGTYVFLTDHSGVGGSHIKPSTDKYDVELLNHLLLRVINQYLYVEPCIPTIASPMNKNSIKKE